MVGMGSIGIQHTRNLALLLEEQGDSFQIDALRTRGNPLPDDVQGLITDTYSSFDTLPCDYDVVFLNSPTSLHFVHLRNAIDHSRHIFVEKPVFDRTDHPWQDLPLHKESVYYVACPLRYHSVIKHIKGIIESQRVFSARSICSSYLPDWRPDADYRECYSSRVDQGGGVRKDLIHEWDYLCYLFGMPSAIHQFHGTFSDLEISSEDLAVYIAKYPDKLVSIHLDYFGRANRREIEIYTDDDVIIGDLISHTVRYMRKNQVLALSQKTTDMQQAELMDFLAMISGEIPNHNTIKNAVSTLQIALGDM